MVGAEADDGCLSQLDRVVALARINSYSVECGAARAVILDMNAIS